MNNKLSELADILIVHEVMEGSNKEFEDILDGCEDESLVMLWDNEPPKLTNTSDAISNKHEWVHINEDGCDLSLFGSSVKLRAFTYECRKCNSKIIVPASETNLDPYGAPTCNEVIVEEVMDK